MSVCVHVETDAHSIIDMLGVPCHNMGIIVVLQRSCSIRDCSNNHVNHHQKKPRGLIVNSSVNPCVLILSPHHTLSGDQNLYMYSEAFSRLGFYLLVPNDWCCSIEVFVIPCFICREWHAISKFSLSQIG